VPDLSFLEVTPEREGGMEKTETDVSGNGQGEVACIQRNREEFDA
jgi:hypothetical protein